MKKASLVASVFAALFTLSAGQAGAAESPYELIQQAAKQGASRVVIPPGTYRVRPGWSIKAHDMEIVGDGVTLIFTKLSRGIDFNHCSNVTFRGFTIDYDPLPFTQGKVIAAAADAGSIDIKIDAGYPREAYGRIDVCDPKTRTRKRGMPFLWGTSAKLIGDDVVRVSLKEIAKTANIGDPVSLSTGCAPDGQPHAVTLSSCDGMTLQDVTLHTAPGMGIIEGDGEGGAKYLHVRIVPGPKPAGATEERLLTTTWDALQTKCVRKGPLVDGCEIADAGDDTWSVQSSDFVVLAASARDCVIGFRDEYTDGPQIGERLSTGIGGKVAKIAANSFVAQAKAGLSDDVLTTLKTAKQYTFWRISSRTMKVTFEQDCPFKVGESVYDPDRICDGFIVRNCNIHSPGRGALVKGGNGLIENNTFTNCHSAVTINAEVPDESASGISNVVIRNNRISGTGYFCPLWNSIQAGSVSIAAGQQAIRNVTVEGNTFDDINGVSICAINVQGLKIEGNHFTRLHQTEPQGTGGQHGIDQHSVVFLNHCTEVAMTGNIADRIGPFTRELLGMGKHLANADELKKGIAVAQTAAAQ